MLEMLEGRGRLEALARLLGALEAGGIEALLRSLRAGEVRVAGGLARRCAYAVVAGTRPLGGDDGVGILLRGVGALLLLLLLLLLGEVGILEGEAVGVEHALGIEDGWVGGRVGEAISGEGVVGRPCVHGSSSSHQKSRSARRINHGAGGARARNAVWV